jgi:hypothetical protein
VQVRRPTGRVLHQYKALGWGGLTTVEAKRYDYDVAGNSSSLISRLFRKARDVHFMNYVRQKHFMKLGVKANKLQRHFVDPTM